MPKTANPTSTSPQGFLLAFGPGGQKKPLLRDDIQPIEDGRQAVGDEIPGSRRWGVGLISSLKGEGLIAVFCACVLGISWWLSTHQDKQGEERQEGINYYKGGEYAKALPLLSQFVKGDDLIVRRLVGRVYALALVGEENRELAKKMFECNSIESCTAGEYEYHIAVEICRTGGNIIDEEDSALYWKEQALSKGFRSQSDQNSEEVCAVNQEKRGRISGGRSI